MDGYSYLLLPEIAFGDSFSLYMDLGKSYSQNCRSGETSNDKSCSEPKYHSEM
jgi:hypothetical protein